jgi:hypothetical protein
MAECSNHGGCIGKIEQVMSMLHTIVLHINILLY